MWKVRKIRFLGVVIGPNGIEMEKEKVDGVKLARAKEYKRYQEIFGPHKLLQERTLCEQPDQ